MSSISIPTGRNASPDPSRISLPSFEPVSHRSKSRDQRPESSASGSRRSRSNDKSRERIADQNSLASTINSRVEVESTNSQAPSRRSSHRSSGGFLLGSLGRSSRIPRLSPKITEDPKGKRKSEDSQLVVPKRRTRHVQTQSGGSHANSPLSAEVHRDSIPTAPNGTRPHFPNTDVDQSAAASHPGPMSNGRGSGQHLEIRRPSPPVFGYDTDPSQIVNMALSLSEARRRQASTKRYVSADQHGGRVVSTASTASQRNRIPRGSIAQYLTPPKPSSATPSVDDGVPTAQPIPQNSPSLTVDPPVGGDADETSILADAEVSDATETRVQLAKTYFELAYEHRRLLSHLPPVRRPGAYVRSSDAIALSKAYNPLQYIRNRKLRIWNKTTFNAEADGWHDVDKVRTWVNTVAEGHHEPRNDPAECVRLPPLSLSEHREVEAGPNGTDHRTQTQPNDRPKPRRPRTDWVTHPGDMLADCFWLEQGVNKIKIRDRDNNQIYPPDTQFRFSGWRNRTPVQVPQNLQQPSPHPDDDEESEQEREPSQAPAPQLPTFKSAHHTSGKTFRARNSRKLKDSFAAMEDAGSKRKGLRLFLDDSSDESDSGDSPGSPGDDRKRGRKRLTRRQVRKNSSSWSPGGELVATTNTKDSIFTGTLTTSDRSQPSSVPNSKRASLDHSRLGRYLKRDSDKGQTPLSRSQNRDEHGRQETKTKFPSFHDRPRSSAEYDSTAPNSPVTAVWPSIAISLESPPRSRTPSPNKKGSSILNPFRDRSHGRHDKVSATDFADLSPAGTRRASGEAERLHTDSSAEASRGTSPMTRGQNPLSKRPSHSTESDSAVAAAAATVATAADHRGSTLSRVSSKSTAPSSDHSKLRGMFKGGRIAELVGHEVSRVGDFIWKREPPGHRRRGSDSTASDRSHHESDPDDGRLANGDVHKTPPRPGVRSRRASSTKGEQLTSPVSSKSPDSGEKPKYNNPNLPSFTSPFERDKEAQEQRKQDLLTPTASAKEGRDHISRLAAEHRSASRSPRLDKLTLPRLDTGRATSPVELQRKTSYGFGAGLDLQRSRDASDKFNSAISDDAHRLRGTKSASDLSRISTAQISHKVDEVENVTSRDIDRAYALLICSAVKAREIDRRANAPGPHVPKFLRETVGGDASEHHHVDLSLVTKREEHVVAARIIMSRLSTQAVAFDDMMKRLSSTVAPSLHRGLQELEDLVDNKLTPRVQKSADDAGELSTKLATTSTLAVKGLNDAIDGAMRRRRRGPIRWVRRLWYASIEYAVVSLLWGIWAVVSFVRLILAMLTGTTRTVRWLLWID